MLNQFSIARFEGILNQSFIEEKNLILEKMFLHHTKHKAKITIPFASFMYFCKKDNYFLNNYRNSIMDVVNYFKKVNEKLIVLEPKQQLFSGI